MRQTGWRSCHLTNPAAVTLTGHDPRRDSLQLPAGGPSAARAGGAAVMRAGSSGGAGPSEPAGSSEGAGSSEPAVPFERVVADHGAVVLRVCRAVVGPHDAEDVGAETFLAALAAPLAAQSPAHYPPPHLARRGKVVQLIVNGEPFLMLAGELHNSSSSSLAYMRPIWPRLKAMHLNTVVVPLSWELIEPTEGHYSWRLLDGLLRQARAYQMHIVFLWLATWKNGLSSYPPLWVKENTTRFPRVILRGRPTTILSAFAPATRRADATAFAAVMRHIKQVDGAQHTVLMMQVENEVGVLGAGRDHSAAANRAFNGPVPRRLLQYLAAHKTELNGHFLRFWRRHGEKTAYQTDNRTKTGARQHQSQHEEDRG